ncbi:hypothetical protein HEK616_08130 [Streptomyces nigrescens]|uniref:Uncharacterized protein n=1 Tax=Streptomyces nigrescens TaxID=1920 RepID=A0ABM7ZLP1_STRNI|nr:hypothetical protein HEK616_08130 [Streptomyces nigrescens]
MRGLTYVELASRTRYHPTTLQRAASGEKLPSRQVALAYGMNCGRSAEVVNRLWQEAWREARRRARCGPWAGPAPQLELVRDFADLSAALVAQHEKNGAPPVREMEMRTAALAAEFGVLSRSSAQRILSRQKVPSSEGQLHAFLMACEVPSEEWPAWTAAWRRACQQREGERESAQGPSLADLEAPFAGESGCIRPWTARLLLKRAGFDPLEGYRGFARPWAARCTSCLSVARVRLSEVLYGGQCTVCGMRADPDSLRPFSCAAC